MGEQCFNSVRAVVPDAVLHPAPSPTHPSITKNVAAPPTSGYASIAAWCEAQDPFSLIGRYVHLDQRGMGYCPFGEHHSDGRDQHPSFRVYVPAVPGGCCWYCYTWGRGGNVFNFLAHYHRLDAKILWSRILAGMAW